MIRPVSLRWTKVSPGAAVSSPGAGTCRTSPPLRTGSSESPCHRRLTSQGSLRRRAEAYSSKARVRSVPRGRPRVGCRTAPQMGRHVPTRLRIPCLQGGARLTHQGTSRQLASSWSAAGMLGQLHSCSFTGREGQ